MSNSGYTPVFASIYEGSLGGKWPAAAVFASILPLADKDGDIDIHPRMLCAMTGWPMELLLEGIKQLEQPDDASRSSDCQGRRLVLIDGHRNWGWTLVNHGKYRERARLAGKSTREVDSGANAARMAGRAPLHPPPEPGNGNGPEIKSLLSRPPVTAGDRPSYTDTDSDSGRSYPVDNSPPDSKLALGSLRCTAATEPEVYEGGVTPPAPPDPKLADPVEPPREEVWARCKAAYPEGVWRGTPHETMGERAVERLLESGIAGSTLIDSCIRCALQAEAAGRIGTTYVRGIGKHFSEGWWKASFPLPKTRAASDQDSAVAAARRFVAKGASNARH